MDVSLARPSKTAMERVENNGKAPHRTELGCALLSELSMEDVGHFTGALRECPGVRGRLLGAERINKILKIVKRALQGAVDQGFLLRSPMAGWAPLRTPKPEMRPFSKIELRR
jgi:hypothetical protein